MKKSQERILIIGACGQLGIELVDHLVEQYGKDVVFPTDILTCPPSELISEHYEVLDVLNQKKLISIIEQLAITTVYHMAVKLSVDSEKNPMEAWELNMKSLFWLLELCRTNKVKRLFWPSSIAVFGSKSNLDITPQWTPANPNSVYGISKCAGELWCAYYQKKYKVDVRSIRYPGILSWKSKPLGGGTTDYAVEMIQHALEGKIYRCFLSEKRVLPMVHINDAINGTLQLINAKELPQEDWLSYNTQAFSFSPKELEMELNTYFPNFEVSYRPDFREEFAKNWPQKIDDQLARTHWGWRSKWNFKDTVKDIVQNLKKIKSF